MSHEIKLKDGTVVRRCPHCRSEQGVYMRMVPTGRGRRYFTFKGKPFSVDLSHVKYRDSQSYYCASCNQVIGLKYQGEEQ